MAHRHAIVFGLLLGLTGAVAPAWAQETAFAVAGVEVDVTAESAAKARARAIADGERRAFAMQLKRLTMQSDHGRLPVLSALEVANLVSDFSIETEKASDVRYLASMGFSFNPLGIRNVLRAASIPFAETISKPLVLLPVVGNAMERRLWDETNPWRDAWALSPQRWDLVPILQPVGDLEDITTVSAEQAAEGDAEALDRLALRYGTDGILVTVVTLGADSQGQPQASVSASSFVGGLLRQTFSFGLKAQADELEPDLLIRAVAETRRQLEDNWKRDNLILFDSESVLLARIPVASLADWVNLKRRISAVAMVTDSKVVSLSRQDVQLNLQYMGAFSQLQLAIKQQDLEVVSDAGDWVIRSLTGGVESDGGTPADAATAVDPGPVSDPDPEQPAAEAPR